MMFSESAKSDVQESISVKDASFERLFEQLETTGTVTLDIPNPYEEGDANLLEWLRSGFTE